MNALSAHELVMVIDDSAYRMINNVNFNISYPTSNNIFIGTRSTKTIKNGPTELSVSLDSTLASEDAFLQKFLDFVPLKLGFFALENTTSFSAENFYISSLTYNFSVGQPGKISMSLVSCSDLVSESVSSIDDTVIQAKNTNIGSFDINLGISDPIIKSFSITFSRDITMVYGCFGVQNKSVDGGVITVSAQSNIEASDYSWKTLANKLSNLKTNLQFTVTSTDNTVLLSYGTGNKMILNAEAMSVSDNELVNLNVEWKGILDV